MEKTLKKGVVINFNIAATRYETLRGVFYGSPIDAFSPRWNKDDMTRALFRVPVIMASRNFALYYIGPEKRSYKEIEKEIRNEGLAFILDPHPSILIGAMRQLGEKERRHIGMKDREVVLAGTEVFEFENQDYFFSVKTIKDLRLLSFSNYHEKQADLFLILERIN